MHVQRPVGWFKSLLESLRCDGAWGLALAALCALLLLPEAGGDAARAVLRYDRAALAIGEGWRLLTAHMVHLNLRHAALNGLGLALMWALFARDYSARHWLIIVLASIAAIDAGLWFGDPELSWYVGASGVLHGLMAAGTLAHLRRRQRDGWILAAFLIVKIGYEQFAGGPPFSAGIGPVVVNAHLYGAAGGLIAALLLRPQAEPL